MLPGAAARRDEVRLDQFDNDYARTTALDYRVMTWLVRVPERFPRSQKLLLTQANLGIEKLRFLLRLAGDLRHVDRRRYEHAARCLDETGRKVGAWNKAHRARESTQPV